MIIFFPLQAEERHCEILGLLLYTAKVIAKQEGLEDGFRIVINDGPKGCKQLRFWIFRFVTCLVVFYGLTCYFVNLICPQLLIRSICLSHSRAPSWGTPNGVACWLSELGWLGNLVSAYIFPDENYGAKNWWMLYFPRCRNIEFIV